MFIDPFVVGVAVRESTGIDLSGSPPNAAAATSESAPQGEAGATDAAPPPPDPVATSLHAWMEARLGRRVRGGDVVRQDGVRVLAKKVRRGMLLEALIGSATARPGN